MDYNTLIAGKATPGSVASWVNSDSVSGASGAVAKDIVADTEEWLSRNMRVRKMQKRIPLTLPVGESEISLFFAPPSGEENQPLISLFLDPIRLYMVGFNDLIFMPEDEIDYRRATGTDGELSESAPRYFAILGDTMYFDTKADEDFKFWFSYYERPQPLSASNLTNLFTTDWRNPFKFAAMGFSYVFLKDEQRAATMFTLAQSEIQKGTVLDDRVRRGMSFDVQVS